MIVPAIHIAKFGNGRSLRFFAAPIEGEHLPWHSMDDLERCLGLDRVARRLLRKKMKSGPFRADVHTISTPVGLTRVAPHDLAQGLIAAMTEMDKSAATFEIEYTREAAKALSILTAGMADENRINFAIAAFRNDNAMPGPHPTIAPFSTRGGAS